MCLNSCLELCLTLSRIKHLLGKFLELEYDFGAPALSFLNCVPFWCFRYVYLKSTSSKTYGRHTYYNYGNDNFFGAKFGGMCRNIWQKYGKLNLIQLHLEHNTTPRHPKKINKKLKLFNFFLWFSPLKTVKFSVC